MTPDQLARCRRLSECGFTMRDIQNLTKLTNAEVRAAIGRAPRRNARIAPLALMEAAHELTREGHDARVIRANFGAVRTLYHAKDDR